MTQEADGIWRADMLDRYPMDSNAMVADLDAPRRELIMTYVAEATRTLELAEALRELARRYPRQLRVKELFETVEAYKRIGQNIYERWRARRVRRVYDLCAGHGLLGVLLANRFPKLPVLCVDAEPRPAYEHLRAVAAEKSLPLENLSYEGADVADVAPAPGSYVICIHACNELTQTVLDHAASAGACFAAAPAATARRPRRASGGSTAAWRWRC